MNPDHKYLTILNDPTPIEIREITTEEYNGYKSDSELINGFNYYLRRIREIEFNSDAYFAVKEHYTTLFQQNDVTPLEYDFKDEGYIDLNRCFINFIASFKSLIEHCENKVAEVYERDSEQFEFFKGILREFYDNDLSYRLLYNLRNYSVHKDFPIEYVNFDKIIQNQERNEYRYEIGVYFSKSKFQENRALRTKMHTFLDDLDDRINTCPFLNRLKPIVKNVMGEFVTTMKPEFSEVADRLIALSDSHENQNLGLTIPSVQQNGSLDYNTIVIPIDAAEKLKQLSN